MNRIRVQCEIDVYDDNNEPQSPIHVKSHWNNPDRVVLIVAKKEYTVIASDLQAAIVNCTNAR